ncbi:hypothetical protein LV82_01922 [Albidovulum inexpectatum]|uniref:Roadblock/LAMTOR2 domain-containing protein n=1 Tax=Albidovulum inexpectatum TaxID=196587 RepID=A0A2S5JGH4_9RHOB|nr:hypothetical protein [Albidovulum inexpectatum]PPB80573.1 hypothetical protein LV82_01922 [Albidovulum inexpectatum]
MANKVVEYLDALADRFPGTSVVAYADLSAGMVLVTNSACGMDRSALDQLCEQACTLLGKAPVLGDAPARRALVGDQDGIALFVRAQTQPDEALLCVAEGAIDVTALGREAVECLDRITNE